MRDLRAALRTEPNLRLAVMFGSLATGRAAERSDVDLLVVLADPSATRVAELAGRLEERTGRDMQLVRLQEAEQVPALMLDAIEHGRVLVDRDRRWSDLTKTEASWRRRAASSELPLDQAMPDLELP